MAQPPTYVLCTSTGKIQPKNYIQLTNLSIWTMITCLCLMKFLFSWLYNATGSDKQQLKIVGSATQKWLNKNTSRANEQAPPLVYEECLSLIKLECQGEGLAESTLALGSCYSGTKAGGGSALEKKVAKISVIYSCLLIESNKGSVSLEITWLTG